MFNEYLEMTEENADIIMANSVIENLKFIVISLDTIFKGEIGEDFYYEDYTFYFYHLQNAFTSCGIAFIRKIVFDDDLVSMLCETATKVQNQANTTLPLLKKQYGDTLKSIDNLLNAIQQGILTPSTKQRMEDLEQQKTELSIQIIKEEMTKPIISVEDIEAYFNRLRILNFKRHDHRRRLIDTFINKIVLWDDGRIYFGCNYKDCSREMTFAELEEAVILGSDISAFGAPKHSNPNLLPIGETFGFVVFLKDVK